MLTPSLRSLNTTHTNASAVGCADLQPHSLPLALSTAYAVRAPQQAMGLPENLTHPVLKVLRLYPVLTGLCLDINLVSSLQHLE